MSLHLARNGQQLGVFTEDEVQSGLASGQFFPDDLYWTDGMAEWQTLSTRFTVTSVAVVPPVSGGADYNPYATPQANIVTKAMGQSQSHLNLASRWIRLGAALLDAIVLMAVIFIPVVIGAGLMETRGRSGSSDTPTVAIAFFVLACLATLGLMIYNIVLLTTQGQTLAKKWLGLRIVTFSDGKNPGFVKAVLLRSVVNTLIGQVVPLYGIVDVCFIFREDKRCLHDLIADTTVITDKPGT